MSWEEIASRNLAAIPRFEIIPSPTTETIAQPRFTSIGFIIPSRISSSRSELKTSFTRSASVSLTQNEIVYSEDDCVIRTTEIPAPETAAKMRLAIPECPRIPVPPTLTIATFLRQEMPHIEPFRFEAKGPLPILVPLAEGLWLFKLHASIPFDASGASVFGCRTLEPKNASSIASS